MTEPPATTIPNTVRADQVREYQYVIFPGNYSQECLARWAEDSQVPPSVVVHAERVQAVRFIGAVESETGNEQTRLITANSFTGSGNTFQVDSDSPVIIVSYRRPTTFHISMEEYVALVKVSSRERVLNSSLGGRMTHLPLNDENMWAIRQVQQWRLDAELTTEGKH